MANTLLWKKLTNTDFNAMHGVAQQAGTGGGAMHIALGVDAKAFLIKDFLNSGTSAEVTLKTAPVGEEVPESTLTFSGNPDRRGGEWRINDQHHHRHPCWTEQRGFPTEFNAQNPPIVMVIRVDGVYHVRYTITDQLEQMPTDLQAIIASANKGVVEFDCDCNPWLLQVGSFVPLETYETKVTELVASESDKFEPDDANDARDKILAEVVRRQGQQSFRKKLLENYGGKCAISGCNVPVALHAAHITPYLGPQTNHVTNGMPLRADIHNLFDLGLLAVEPKTFKVLVSSQLVGTEYEEFAGSKLHLPASEDNWPSEAAIKSHLDMFLE